MLQYTHTWTKIGTKNYVHLYSCCVDILFLFFIEFNKKLIQTLFSRELLGYKLNLDAKSQKPNVKRRQMYVHFPH